MTSAAAVRLRLLVSVLSCLILAAAAFGGWFYTRMRASLPKLDGEAAVQGLGAKVMIERDALGVPTLHASSRKDGARALGYLHGQDRFFQMDLSRRRASGELAELFGKAAVSIDQRARLHGFRSLAQTVLTKLPVEERELLDAYAGGVNAGLEQLRAPPFEYLVTRTSPRPWKPEDCVLLIYAMTLDLQNEDGNYEQTLATLRDRLGLSGLAFFAPLVAPNDAALDGSVAPQSPIPPAKQIDLRQTSNEFELKTPQKRVARAEDDPREFSPGSNAFAVAGSQSAKGFAILANDMHLGLRVPNVWYRASLICPSLDGKSEIHLTGVTLPGTPLFVAGSNGHIAWGFTNSYVDISDIVIIDPSKIDESVYGRGADVLQIEKRKEIIHVKGEADVIYEAPWTVWGPIVGKNGSDHPLALKWVAHDPEATNFSLRQLETATTVNEAIDVAHHAGIPAQNFLVVDTTGNLGWTICGKIPKRVGLDGRLPISWAFGDRRWEGYLAPDEVPTIIAPPSGKLWTANQRMLDADALLKLGDGGYTTPARAARIRDDLTALSKATERDLLAIQLDDHAPQLDRWHTLFLSVLNDAAISQKKSRGELRRAAETWEGRATVDSVSYRLVRLFREKVRARIFTPLFAHCLEQYPDFNFARFNYEPALWQLVQEKPAHFLSASFLTWDDLLLAAADDVTKTLDDENVPVAKATWGRHNVAAIRHPLSPFLPGFLSSCLDMPADQLAGDYDVPRVTSPANGASERFVVSPGHEAEGFFHMPGGQSGHPLSPFYRAGHEAWVKGEATPFLPGTTVHTLVLGP